MHDTKNVVLNAGQRELVEGFFHFLFSDKTSMIMSGPGGVGKTFVMGYMIDNIMPRYYETCQIMGISPEYEAVEMTATTNKAAESLSQSTGRPAETIHSFLNLMVRDNYSTGESNLVRTAAWQVHMKKILFIDECSMVDRQLLEAIEDGTHQCKLIYVGDHCQLAPIKEPISPIYRRNFPIYDLIQPMRNQNQPALMALCQQLRNTVETNEFKPIKIIPGVVDWLDDTQMKAKIASEFMMQVSNKRILGYTNKRVVEYNEYIRGIRLLGPEYTVGEYLVNNSAIQIKDRMLSVEEQVLITKTGQSEMITIEPGTELHIRRVSLETKDGATLNNVMLPIDRAHYDDLLRYYSRWKRWKQYFYLKNNFPDLRQRDAATVHKAQGSTYDEVFIDLGNISTCHNANQVARMLYVAVSRPRTRIYLYGNLADKYGGLSL